MTDLSRRDTFAITITGGVTAAMPAAAAVPAGSAAAAPPT